MQTYQKQKWENMNQSQLDEFLRKAFEQQQQQQRRQSQDERLNKPSNQVLRQTFFQQQQPIHKSQLEIMRQSDQLFQCTQTVSNKQLRELESLLLLDPKLSIFLDYITELKKSDENNKIRQFFTVFLCFLKYPKKTFSFSIQGITDLYWYRIKGRQQFLYLMGESHDVKGNALGLIQKLARETNCPIHILVEKDFESIFKFKPISSPNLSNVSSFNVPPIDICTQKGKVPRQQNIRNPMYFQFVQNCIRPYQGKIKIWGVDLRKSSLFGLLLSTSLFLNGLDYREFYKKVENEWKDWFQATKIFLKNTINFPLARSDINAYNQQVITSLHNVLENIPPEYNKGSTEAHIRALEKVLKTRDKSHMDFVKSILFLPEELTERWRLKAIEFLNKDIQSVLFHSILLDLYMMTRLYRILVKQKEGYILFFGGKEHTNLIDNILEESDFIEKLSHLKPQMGSTSVNMVFPKLDCTEKTRFMEFYQSELRPQQTMAQNISEEQNLLRKEMKKRIDTIIRQKRYQTTRSRKQKAFSFLKKVFKGKLEITRSPEIQQQWTKGNDTAYIDGMIRLNRLQGKITSNNILNEI